MPEINKPQYQDPEKARKHLERLRWPDGPICPHCGSVKAWPLNGKKHRPGLYKCAEYECRQQFTVTVGTLFERSKVPLNTWLQAVYYMCASKKGMSAKQLERMLGVTYKTAWFMCHRIREAMKDPVFSKMGGGGKTVEVDETFWGNTKKRGAPKKGRGYHHKEKIFTLVERDGRARSFHVSSVNAKTLKPIMKAQIHDDTNIMSDEAFAYTKVGREFLSHGVVKHGKGEYVRGEIHTNTIESYFAILKRGLHGTFHHVGPQHLKRYIGEFDFRYNHRKITDAERTDEALKGITGKRLLYKQPQL